MKKIGLNAFFAVICVCLSHQINPLYAEPINLPIDNIGVIYPYQNDPNPYNGLKIALFFTVPESLSEKQISYSEVQMNFPVNRYLDSTFIYDIFPIISPWVSDSISWEYPWANPGGDFDSTEYSSRYYTIDNNFRINFDITNLTCQWAAGLRSNYGFFISVHFLNHIGFRFNINRFIPYMRENLSLIINFNN